MLTVKQIIEKVENGEMASRCIDGRDFSRLVDQYIPYEHWDTFGFGLKDENAEPPMAQELTRESVLESLERDLGFAFEKSIDKRGISSGLMVSVIEMWMEILEDDELQSSDDMYWYYGLPYLKAVALKYNLENPIGEDSGSEDKYS